MRGADDRSDSIADEDGAGNGTVVEQLVEELFSRGVDGFGPVKGARAIADEHLARCRHAEAAIERLIATHSRLVAATGLATGMGGWMTMPVTVPTDVGVFSLLSTRCVAAVAYSRGHDLASEGVRSVVLLSLLGAGGAALAAEFGAQLGTRSAPAVLQRLPRRTLTDINRRVGVRACAEFGRSGLIDLGRWVPTVGGFTSASVNAAAMWTAGHYAKRNFPRV